MSDKPIVIVYKESLAQSVISDLATFGFLLICIWASQGSKWWTFFTGAMFLVVVCAKLAALTKSDRVQRFYSLDEMQSWIAKQEKEPTCKSA